MDNLVFVLVSEFVRTARASRPRDGRGLHNPRLGSRMSSIAGLGQTRHTPAQVQGEGAIEMHEEIG